MTFDFPVITSAAEAAGTMAAILTAVSAGITPAEASDVGKLVESYVKAVEAADLSARIERLERMTHQ